MKQKVTFSTYPNLQSAFKELCEAQCVTMGEQIELVTKDYLKGNLPLSQLRESLVKYKAQSDKEEKEFKSTFHLDADLYLKLKDNLKETRIRPASFFCFVMAYSITTLPTQQIYAKKAQILLEASSIDIEHVVYALKYYKPTPDKKLIFVHEEFCLDACTSERFMHYYAEPNSPFVQVLALHR